MTESLKKVAMLVMLSLTPLIIIVTVNHMAYIMGFYVGKFLVVTR